MGRSETDGGRFPDVGKDLLTVEQVAQLLDVHPMTVYRMVEKGKLPGFKVGTHWRFLKGAMEDWMTDQTQVTRLKTEGHLRKEEAA